MAELWTPETAYLPPIEVRLIAPGEEYLHTMFEHNFRMLEYQMRRNERIPAEFRLLDFEKSPKVIATTLGKLIVPGSLDLRRIAA